MSKINALRIINLNYNNNAIHIDDETFRFDGESTLLSLRNGGGKSVMVQMIIAPFVHKSFRNTKDRPFNSFFTTNRPTFILVEWALDGKAGYVLTGMMVRKNQSNDDVEDKDALEIINIISEYKEKCKWDINNLAVIEKSTKEKKLNGFGYCKQLFESLKKDPKVDFNYYDMNNSGQSKRYFEKLKEFQIDYKEWETIIKKINLKESGLSELFTDAKDEKGLIDKWFLETVENKLNKEKSRIKEFDNLILKYIMQYKENQSKIQQKETINRFKEEAVEINRRTEEYVQVTEEQFTYENRIACLIQQYEMLKKHSEYKKDELDTTISNIDDTIKRIEYEEISFDIYHMEDKKDLLIKDYEEFTKQRQQVTDERTLVLKKLNIQECAKYYKEYQDASREQQLYENRLEIARQKESELTPERNTIGYNLRFRYESERDDTGKLLDYLKNQIKLDLEEAKQLKDKKSESEKEKEVIHIKSATLKERISIFDEVEEKFNKRFFENLMRNIMGEYEPAILDIKKRENQETVIKINKKTLDYKKQKEDLEEEIRSLNRRLEDNQKEDFKCGEDIKALQKEIESYDEELSARRIIIKYVNLLEEDIYNKHKIVEAFDKKILEFQSTIRNLEREYEKLDKEYNRLKQGKVLELPKDFEALLDSLNINHVYGMEWLKKNGRTPEENERFVDNNPFIPYSIILSKPDMVKLQRADLNIYTSFPIPIINRENLERVYDDVTTSIEGMDKVSFFVMFNKNLLDAEKLSSLILSKEEELNKKLEQINQRKSEQNSYIEKKDIVKHHKVEKDLYDKTNLDMEKSVKLKKALEDKVISIKDEQQKTQDTQSFVTDEIYKAQNDINKWNEKTEEFNKLCEKYNAYIINRRQLNKLEERIIDIKSTLATINKNLEDLSNRLNESDKERFEKNKKYENLSEKVLKYSHYSEGEISNKDTEDLEARYKAITENISSDQKQLEELLMAASKRYIDCEKQLIKKAEKHELIQNEYDSIVYDEFTENRLEKELEQKNCEISEYSDKVNQVDKKIALLENNIKTLFERMKEKCNKEEPANREIIKEINFKIVLSEKKEEKKKELDRLNEVKSRIGIYENSLSVFDDYSNFELKEDIEFTMNFETMTEKELKDYNGAIRRDYRETILQKTDKQSKLRDILNKVARMDEFSDEFYRKPIEMLIELLTDAMAVRIQLDTILKSYDSLMEKLLIDIAFIDKEKEKVNELLLDYVFQVHDNLGKIDKNSTITVRGKSIKMLKILLLNWEENEPLFEVRIKDFIENITSKALITIENNENLEELVGKCITTRNLYDAVVGISNIEIKLYKIEEQREYPITWAEVSRNSGGEGFLSAFVILSSLLYYMRKDDTDLFAEKEEGKVLLMDNPFAQTNSSHLLKPLMDMAKKTNTQLICLSGLGGDSIYNRFDNIYVLNLVSSNLRKGMQYMKLEHIKGLEEDSEEMVLARVLIEDEIDEYYEQESLF